MDLFVDHLPADVTDEEVAALFQCHGMVEATTVLRRWGTPQTLGVALVTMPQAGAAETAIAQLNGLALRGYRLVVSHFSTTAETPAAE